MLAVTVPSFCVIFRLFKTTEDHLEKKSFIKDIFSITDRPALSVASPCVFCCLCFDRRGFAPILGCSGAASPAHVRQARLLRQAPGLCSP